MCLQPGLGDRVVAAPKTLSIVRVGGSALLLPAEGQQQLREVNSDLLTVMLQRFRWVGGVSIGVVALLYITSMFEGLMHGASGLLQGQSRWLAGAVGLAVGMLHTASGPDPLAGLAPLVVGQRRSVAAAFGLGALWGSGHATGQMIIGAVCLAVQAGLLHLAWSPVLGQASSLLVGASLVAIGLLGYREGQTFEEDGLWNQQQTTPRMRGKFGWATYATGVLYGLSPDALLFIAPALALPRLAGVFHVAGVVMGTLLSMGGCTALLGALCQRSARLKLISSSASSVAMLLGVCIMAASIGISFPLPGF